MTKKMDLQEFRDLGLLQEVNRQFFHPMGLALEIIQESDGTMKLGGIWDFRDDPEGMCFEERLVNPGKIRRVAELFEAKRETRERVLGYHIQPALRDG